MASISISSEYNQGMIPRDSKFPRFFLEALEKQNSAHLEEAPVAVVLLSGVHCEAHFSLSNYHLIHQINQIYRIFLRTAQDVSWIPKCVKQASEITGVPVSLLFINGHGISGERLRVGKNYLENRNSSLLNCKELALDARIFLKGCRILNGVSSWDWKWPKSIQIEGPTEPCSSFRTFFHQGRFLAFSELGIQEAGIFTHSGMEIPPAEKDLFEKCMLEKSRYLEAYTEDADRDHVSKCYLYFARYLVNQQKREQAISIYAKAMQILPLERLSIFDRLAIGTEAALESCMNDMRPSEDRDRETLIERIVSLGSKSLLNRFIQGRGKPFTREIWHQLISIGTEKSLNLLMECWHQLDSSERARLIEAILKLNSKTLVVNLLNIEKAVEDNHLILSNLFLHACDVDSMELLETIASYKEFPNLPLVVANNRWYFKAYWGAGRPEILEHLSASPLAVNISPDHLGVHLDASAAPEMIRAISRFPNAKDIPIEKLSELIKTFEEKEQHDQVAALKQWPQFSMSAIPALLDKQDP